MLKKILAILTAILSFNLFFYGAGVPHFGTISFLLLNFTAQAFLWIAFYQKKILVGKDKLALTASSLSIMASLIAIFRASSVDRFLLGFLSLVLILASAYLLALSHTMFGALSELIYVPKKIVNDWFANFFKMVTGAIRQTQDSTKVLGRALPKKLIPKSIVFTLVRGLLITVPVVGVIIFLLVQADPIFSKLVSDVLNVKIQLPDFLKSLPYRLSYSLLLLFALIPVAMLKIDQQFVSPLKNNKLAKYKGEFFILVVSLSVVLAAFLIIQFRYLFANVPETQLHQFGINTYSEYVRKGFIEMTLVSVIVYLVSASSFLVYRSAEKTKSWLKRFNLLLLAQMLIFIISVFRRVVLYQVEHGLTRIRVYGMMLLLVLIGLTAILWLRQVKKQLKNWYLCEIAVVAVVIFLSTLLNVDKLIATVLRPTVNDEIDYTYIVRLSADGYDGWEKAWQHVRKLVVNTKEIDFESDQVRQLVYAHQTLIRLKQNYEFLINKYGSAEEKQNLGWQTQQKVNNKFNFGQLNISEWQAYQKLRDEISYDELLRVYNRSLYIYQSLPAKAAFESYDRSNDTPLLK